MPRVIAILLFAVFLFPGCIPPGSNIDSSSTDSTVDASAIDATIDKTANAAPATPPVPPQPAVPGKLTIGDPAPAIAVAQWIKGEPLDGLASGKVNVVEFWATWCGPCLRNMPHLSKLQDEYGDKINVMGFTGEDADTVNQFMTMEQSAGKTWDEVLTYRVAIDKDSKTNKAYMSAAEQRGIPCAFIVGKDGFVEWIGHPAAMDEPLASIVDGNWDRAVALAERKRQKEFEAARSAFGERLNELMASEDYDGAIAGIEDFSSEHPEMADQLMLLRATVLGSAGRSEEQVAAFREIIEKTPDNSGLLNQIAWGIAAETEGGDLDFALQTALQASELTEHKDPSILDTVARVHYELGDLELAAEWQGKAVAAANGNESLAKTLKKYADELAAKTADETESEQDGDEHGEDSDHEHDGDDHEDGEHDDGEHGDADEHENDEEHEHGEKDDDAQN